MHIDPDWLRALEQRIDLPPEQVRVPLRLACPPGATRIGSIESDLALALAGAGVPIVDTGDAWRIDVASASIEPSSPGPRSAAPSPDGILAALADVLRAQGCAGAWRDELLAVTDLDDADDRPVARIERAAVRPLGIATHAVHLIVHTPDGRVWVQQRAFDKSTDPGRWDTTMGGLIAADESVATALERETWEEAGLHLDALHEVRSFGRFTVRRPVPHGYMVERTELYEARVDDGAVPANQDGEVERFECLDRQTLLERLHADAFTLEAALALARWWRHREALGAG